MRRVHIERNNNADKENQFNDETNLNSIKLEEIKNPFEGNKVLENIGARHLNPYDRRFSFQADIELLEKGRYDCVKMTKEDFMEILG